MKRKDKIARKKVIFGTITCKLKHKSVSNNYLLSSNSQCSRLNVFIIMSIQWRPQALLTGFVQGSESVTSRRSGCDWETSWWQTVPSGYPATCLAVGSQKNKTCIIAPTLSDMGIAHGVGSGFYCAGSDRLYFYECTVGWSVQHEGKVPCDSVLW